MKNLSEPLCDPFEESFENAFGTDSDFGADSFDLTEWMDDKYEPGLDLSEDITSATVVSIDMFDEDQNLFAQTENKRSSSSDRKRPRPVTPERNGKNTKRHQVDRCHSKSLSPFDPSIPEDVEYKQVMSKVASEISKAINIDPSEQPSPSTLSSLVELLSGKRSSLTTGLEHSRKQLRTYMSLML